MTAWLLTILLIVPGGSATITAEFADQESCRAGGSAIARVLVEDGFTPEWTCKAVSEGRAA